MTGQVFVWTSAKVVDKLLISLFILMSGIAATSWGAAFWKRQTENKNISTARYRLHETLASVRRGAESHLLSALGRDSLFVYAYDVGGDSVLPGNNEIRQLMAARVLAQLATADSTHLNDHRKNLQKVIAAWYKETEYGSGYMYFNGISKLGANAMALRVLVSSPDFDRHAEKAQALARGIRLLYSPGRGFDPWFAPPPGGDEAADRLLAFYSGEALLALMEYALKVEDPATMSFALGAQDRYISQYVDEIDKNFHPAYVPWHTMSLALAFQYTGERKYARAVMTLNDALLPLQDRQRYPGRFFNPATPQYGQPHAASDAVYTEGLAHAWRLAFATGDLSRARKFERAIHLALHNLSELQFSDSDLPMGFGAGAIATQVGSRRTRIDNTQHALDAMWALETAIQEVMGSNETERGRM